MPNISNDYDLSSWIIQPICNKKYGQMEKIGMDNQTHVESL